MLTRSKPEVACARSGFHGPGQAKPTRKEARPGPGAKARATAGHRHRHRQTATARPTDSQTNRTGQDRHRHTGTRAPPHTLFPALVQRTHTQADRVGQADGGRQQRRAEAASRQGLRQAGGTQGLTASREEPVRAGLLAPSCRNQQSQESSCCGSSLWPGKRGETKPSQSEHVCQLLPIKNVQNAGTAVVVSARLSLLELADGAEDHLGITRNKTNTRKHTHTQHVHKHANTQTYIPTYKHTNTHKDSTHTQILTIRLPKMTWGKVIQHPLISISWHYAWEQLTNTPP